MISKEINKACDIFVLSVCIFKMNLKTNVNFIDYIRIENFHRPNFEKNYVVTIKDTNERDSKIYIYTKKSLQITLNYINCKICAS